MIAVETRKPYSELPTAFRYREAAEFRACDLKRYSQRVAELRARSVTPANMDNAIIPLPTARPDMGTVSDIPSSGTGGTGAGVAGATAPTAPVVPASAKPVRVVGPTFFPAN